MGCQMASFHIKPKVIHHLLHTTWALLIAPHDTGQPNELTDRKPPIPLGIQTGHHAIKIIAIVISEGAPPKSGRLPIIFGICPEGDYHEEEGREDDQRD